MPRLEWEVHHVPAYPIANSCSGFCPFPLPPNSFGIESWSFRSLLSTLPLRPAPVAVALAVYYSTVVPLARYSIMSS
jgi:hypothetical protein